jgi:hypothetical protein
VGKGKQGEKKVLTIALPRTLRYYMGAEATAPDTTALRWKKNGEHEGEGKGVYIREEAGRHGSNSEMKKVPEKRQRREVRREQSRRRCGQR